MNKLEKKEKMNKLEKKTNTTYQDTIRELRSKGYIVNNDNIKAIYAHGSALHIYQYRIGVDIRDAKGKLITTCWAK